MTAWRSTKRHRGDVRANAEHNSITVDATRKTCKKGHRGADHPRPLRGPSCSVAGQRPARPRPRAATRIITSSMLASEKPTRSSPPSAWNERRRPRSRAAQDSVRVIRLGVRLARYQAEPVLCELLKFVPAGFKERDVDKGRHQVHPLRSAQRAADVGGRDKDAGEALVEVVDDEVWTARDVALAPAARRRPPARAPAMGARARPTPPTS